MAYFKAFIKDTPFGISILLFALAVGFVALIAPVGGNKALIVRSGSMQPTIGVGDLITAKPQKEYKVGDIIAFKDPLKSSVLVTHRIIGQEIENGKIYFKTKGDGNENADFNLVSKENVIGRADISIKGIGKLLAYTKTNIGFGAVVILPALLVIFFEIINIFREIKKQKNVRTETPEQPEYPIVTPIIEIVNFSRFSNRHKLGFRMPSFKILLPLALSTLLVYNTLAFLFDSEISTGNFFQAADSFGPPIAQTLVINEILYDTNCGTPENKQWIELWNGSSSIVDLKDWSLRDQDNNTIQIVNSVTLLNPGQFALLSKSQATWNDQCYGDLLSGTVTANLGGTININTSAGTIKLLDVSLNVVDRVDYGGATGLSAGVNRSLERKILGQDSVTGDNFASADFEMRSPPTAGFAIPQNQSVVINEFLVNDGSAGQGKDWVEIYNKSGSSVDISSWTLRDTTGIFHTFPASTSLAAGAFFATADMSNRLNNGGDKIYLFDNSGSLIDGVSYFKFVPSDGNSIGRTTDGALIWSTFTTPTKGITNTSPTSPWP